MARPTFPTTRLMDLSSPTCRPLQLVESSSWTKARHSRLGLQGQALRGCDGGSVVLRCWIRQTRAPEAAADSDASASFLFHVRRIYFEQTELAERVGSCAGARSKVLFDQRRIGFDRHRHKDGASTLAVRRHLSQPCGLKRQHAYHGMHAAGTSLAGIAANIRRTRPAAARHPRSPLGRRRCSSRRPSRPHDETWRLFFCEPGWGLGRLRPTPRLPVLGFVRYVATPRVLFVADEVITGFGRCGDWFGLDPLEPSARHPDLRQGHQRLPADGACSPRLGLPTLLGQGRRRMASCLHLQRSRGARRSGEYANIAILERERRCAPAPGTATRSLPMLLPLAKSPLVSQRIPRRHPSWPRTARSRSVDRPAGSARKGLASDAGRPAFSADCWLPLRCSCPVVGDRCRCRLTKRSMAAALETLALADRGCFNLARRLPARCWKSSCGSPW